MGRIVFGLFLIAFGAVFVASLVFDLSSGVAKLNRFGTFRRADEPLNYWLAMALNAGAGLFLMGMGVAIVTGWVT